jgi:hypothetical protein
MALKKTVFTLQQSAAKDGVVTLKLSGYLDENASLNSSTVEASVKTLMINFQELVFINSIGIKYWVDFMGQLGERENLKIIYQNCRKQIVDSVNTISGFLPPNAEIQSFYSPVYCSQCDRSFEILQNSSEIKEDADKAVDAIRSLVCKDTPECKGILEIDFNPKTYYAFLSES